MEKVEVNNELMNLDFSKDRRGLHEEIEDKAFLDAYNSGKIFARFATTEDNKRFLIVDDWEDVRKIQELLDPEFNSKDRYDTSVLDDYCEWGFSDEYAVCDSCGKLIRTEADSYHWKADFFFDDVNYELLCGDCVRKNPENYIGWLLEKPEDRANTILDKSDLEDLGFETVDEEYESGWYDRNDNPAEILEKARETYPDADFIFNITGVAQFAVNFELMKRER